MVTVRPYTRKKHRESHHFIAGLVSRMAAARYYSREKVKTAAGDFFVVEDLWCIETLNTSFWPAADGFCVD